MGDVTEEMVKDSAYLAMRAEIAEDLEKGETGESDQESFTAEDHAETSDRHVEDDAVTDDPWEGVNPKLKDAFVSMTEQVKELGTSNHRVKQLESRVGAITNELHAAKAAAVTEKVAPTEEQMAAATQSDEKWERLKGDFPEWADAIDGRLNAIKGGSEDVVALKAEIESIKTGLAGKASEGVTNRLIAEAVTSYAHPKWKNTIQSADYAAWLAIQKPEFITLAETSTDFSDAISVLSAFEASKKKPQRTASEIAAARSDRLRASGLPEGGKSDAPKSESDMSEQELRTKIGREIFSAD